MRLKKAINRFCPYCNKKTAQKVSLVSTGGKRGSLRWGSLLRAAKRGQGVGLGNQGRWGSKPAVKSWKRKTKATKRLTILYTCKTCNKSKPKSESIRVNKIQLE